MALLRLYRSILHNSYIKVDIPHIDIDKIFDSNDRAENVMLYNNMMKNFRLLDDDNILIINIRCLELVKDPQLSERCKFNLCSLRELYQCILQNDDVNYRNFMSIEYHGLYVNTIINYNIFKNINWTDESNRIRYQMIISQCLNSPAQTTWWYKYDYSKNLMKLINKSGIKLYFTLIK
jgi:hypothetical protein